MSFHVELQLTINFMVTDAILIHLAIVSCVLILYSFNYPFCNVHKIALHTCNDATQMCHINNDVIHCEFLVFDDFVSFIYFMTI